jgi:hypothetical protein
MTQEYNRNSEIPPTRNSQIISKFGTLADIGLSMGITEQDVKVIAKKIGYPIANKKGTVPILIDSAKFERMYEQYEEGLIEKQKKARQARQQRKAKTSSGSAGTSKSRKNSSETLTVNQEESKTTSSDRAEPVPESDAASKPEASSNETPTVDQQRSGTATSSTRRPLRRRSEG